MWAARYFAEKGFEMIVSLMPPLRIPAGGQTNVRPGSPIIFQVYGAIWYTPPKKRLQRPFLITDGTIAERLGAVHVLSKSSEVATKVTDQLRSLIRWEFSSSPAFGARLASIILNDAQLKDEW